MFQTQAKNIQNIHNKYLKSAHYFRSEQIKILEENMKKIETARLAEIRQSIKS